MFAGALTTAAVLCGGLASFKAGDKRMGQMFMKARVAAQFGTVAAMVYYATASGALDVTKKPQWLGGD